MQCDPCEVLLLHKMHFAVRKRQPTDLMIDWLPLFYLLLYSLNVLRLFCLKYSDLGLKTCHIISQALRRAV